MKGFIKDPDARLDYSFDWGPWLDGDELSASDWTVDSGTITIVVGSKDYTIVGITRVYVEGGIAGENATLRNTISTVGGRTDERSIEIRVRER